MLDEGMIAGSPLWFPLRLAGGGAAGAPGEAGAGMAMVELTETAYRTESFLDLRLLARGYEEVFCPIATLVQAAQSLKARPHYIFHIGHAGSTLISRLIGAHEQCLSLREPQLLRALAEASAGPPGEPPTGPPAAALPLGLMLPLLGRTWHSGQRAVVKATSIASEIAPLILGGEDRPAAVFMFVDAFAYLRGILAGPNSRVESRALAPARLRRLQQRLTPAGDAWHPRTEGEVIAMSWLCEMTTLYRAWEARAAQVQWVNFDEFLKTPAPVLAQVLDRLGARVPARDVEALVTGPLMHRYSKAPEHAYDAALRRDVLASAEWEHPAEIKRGMAWLESLAGRQALVRDVLRLRAT
jgi:hypothetical protein